MQFPKKEWERRFEAIRDEILGRMGTPLKKEAVQDAVPNWTLSRAKEYATPRHQKPWEAQYEAVRDEVLSRWRGRVERVKEEFQRTGKIDLTKSAEDFDPFLVRVERYLGKPDLRKDAERSRHLYKAVDKARARLEMLKGLEVGLTPFPWRVTKGDLRKARLDLTEDLLTIWSIRRSLA